MMATDVGLHTAVLHQRLKGAPTVQNLAGPIFSLANTDQGQMADHEPCSSGLCLSTGQLLSCPDQLVLGNPG